MAPRSDYPVNDHRCTDLHSLGFIEIILVSFSVYSLPPKE